jgi:hypothetical protein
MAIRNDSTKQTQICTDLAVKWPSLPRNALLRVQFAGGDGSSNVKS